MKRWNWHRHIANSKLFGFLNDFLGYHDKINYIRAKKYVTSNILTNSRQALALVAVVLPLNCSYLHSSNIKEKRTINEANQI